MIKLFLPLVVISFLLSGCYSKVVRHTGNTGGTYYGISGPGSYDYYTGKTSYYSGYTTPEGLKEALKLKEKYGEDVNIILNYTHTQYEFSFVKDSVVVGKPIQVKETNEEMATSLSDDVRFFKNEQFNNSVSFEGFYENFSGELDTSFVKSSYLESQVGSGGIFYSDAKRAESSWSLPVPGSTVRVRYNKLYEDVKYFNTVFFNEGYPKQESVITFKIPTWLDVEIIERNFEGYEIHRMDSGYTIGRKLIPKKAEKTTTKKTTSSKASKNNKAPKPIASSDKYRYVTYIMNNVQASKDEDLFPGATHNYPHLIVLCKSYDSVAVAKLKKEPVSKDKKTTKTTTQTKSQTTSTTKTSTQTKSTSAKGKKTKEEPVVNRELPKNIKGTIANTQDLYHWCYEIASLANNKIDSVKPLAMEIVKGKTTDKEKVEAIFYWVQDNIRYVAFEDGIAAFKPDACQNVLEKRYGDCKGMANLIKCMLVSLGYDARLTWIGTRRLNIEYSVPSVATSNHMICSVVLDGKRYFLDGTEKYISLGDYAHRIQGRPVMIEDSLRYIIDTVPDLPYTRNQHNRKADFTIAEDGKLIGKVTETMKGENKTNFLYRYHYSAKSDRPFIIKQHLKDYDPNFDLANITHTNLEDRTSDLVLNYDLSIRYNTIKQGNLIMIKPDYIGELTNHDNDTSRMSKIAYGHKLYYTHSYNYSIPSGYTVKELPKSLTINNSDYSFLLTYKQVGNQIVYEKTLILNSGYIDKKGIKQWNADINALEKNYNSYIILSKN